MGTRTWQAGRFQGGRQGTTDLTAPPGPGAYEPRPWSARPCSTKGSIGPRVQVATLPLAHLADGGGDLSNYDTTADREQILSALQSEFSDTEQRPASARIVRSKMQAEHRLDFGPAAATSRVEYSTLPSQFDAAARPSRNPTSAFGTASRFKKKPVTLIGEEPGPGAYTVVKDRKGGGSWVTASLAWHKRVGRSKPNTADGGKESAAGSRLDFGPEAGTPAPTEYDVITPTSDFSLTTQGKKNRPSSAFGTGGRFASAGVLNDQNEPGPGAYQPTIAAVFRQPRTTTFGPGLRRPRSSTHPRNVMA